MSTPYTVLRVTEASGVPLFEGHVGRLGESSRGALRHFASQAMPGVYRVTWDGLQLTTSQRPGSRLTEGMPTRFVVSPFAGQKGRFAKPAPPTPYDPVRLAGIATLLTDTTGTEIYEACVASVIAWDGESLVLPPEEVPAVASLAEAEIAARFPHRRARVLVASDWPLLLINAVVGTCALHVEGRAAFPTEVRAKLDAQLSSATEPVGVSRSIPKPPP
ncbi:MAG: hypothetical protein Q8L48_03475 [Archangium sp.]|nr:hypothetical protein [Archangium sp.]